MAKTTWLMAGLVLVVSGGAGWPAAAEPINPEGLAGVRSSSALVAALIAMATEESATFRGLVEAIGASDGIVYVEVGQCGHYVRSCVVGVSVAGGFRVVWIEVDTDRADLDLIASIGHELQHAVELLSDSNVRSRSGMYSYYSRRGRRARGTTAFETTAAIKAGDTVREEIRRAVATEPSAAVANQLSRMAPDARVRGVSARVVAIVNEATAQSTTFRGLVDQINRTDGTVYVEEGDCGSGARACLLLRMTMMGSHRLLRILVDRRATDRDLMASIGHELQHAVEVLDHRSVRSSSEMILLYKRICDVCGDFFETHAAIRAGNDVHDELLEIAR